MDSLKIGNITLPHRAVFGPMAGFTDAPCRRLMAQHGAGFTVSEMVSSRALVYHDHKTVSLLKAEPNGAPYGVQIFGEIPQIMGEAAAAIEEYEFDFLDINMGCPAKKVNRKLAGSALLQFPDLVEKILKEVVNAVDVPVTLKIRTGWDKANRNCVQIGKIAEQSGIQALTIHGRTKECLFEGEAEYDNIRAVKQSISIPVIANGDIDSASKAKKVLEYTGADAIMIGRAALGNPWLFQAVEALVEHDTIIQTPSLREKCGHILRHIQELHQFYGEQKGYRIARKHVAWYLQGIQPDSVFRQTFNAINEPKEQLIVLEDFLNSILDKEKC